VGTEVDRYRLEALLGEGATAWVFKAEHAFLHRKVALKLLKPQPVSDNELTKRFLSEGQAVATLRHPNVIEVYDCGVTPEGSLWIALELVPGISLRQLISKSKALPVAQAAKIGSGVLAALAAAHGAGIVHRDLKPENILLAPGDKAKVVDFGIAKVLSTSHGTTTGGFLGTPRYASPEQAQGKESAPPTDIYATGLILYEMLAGEGPFKSETPFGYLTQHTSAAPPPLRTKAPQVPEKLAEAVMRALEKDPAARFPNAEAMRRAVTPFAPKAAGDGAP
jgi:serine/threonine-protein kinase